MKQNLSEIVWKCLESYGKPLSQTCVNLLQSICRCRHVGSFTLVQKGDCRGRERREGREGRDRVMRAKFCPKQQRYLRYSEMIHPESSRYIQIHGTQQFVMDEAMIRQWFTDFSRPPSSVTSLCPCRLGAWPRRPGFGGFGGCGFWKHVFAK